MDEEEKTELELETWSSYQRLVIAELERLNDSVESMRDVISNLKTEIQVLKVKSSLWGTFGGGLTVAVALFFDWLKK